MQEYWSGLTFPPPGDLPDSGIKPRSLALQADSLPSEPPDYRYFRASVSSVTQSSPTLWPHEPQHTRPPCPSPSPGIHSDSRPSSQWCHPAISSSVIPFSSCLQFFPASGSFQMGQLFASGGQSIGVSASTWILPMNIQDQFPLGLMVGSSYSPRDSLQSSPTPQFKSINSLVLSFLYSSVLTSIHDYWKNHNFD